MAADDENVVSYTVKELLADIKSSVEQLRGMLTTKADRADVEQLHRRIDATEGRIDHESERINGLEKSVDHHERSKAERGSWRTWAVPSIATLVLVAATLIQIFVK